MTRHRFPDEAQICFVPDMDAYVEITECDDAGDPYFMKWDDLVRARHLGISHACSWNLRRLRPVTKTARAMVANIKRHSK